MVEFGENNPFGGQSFGGVLNDSCQKGKDGDGEGKPTIEAGVKVIMILKVIVVDCHCWNVLSSVFFYKLFLKQAQCSSPFLENAI